MLSKRLLSLVDYFNKEDRIIDIGCDHAYLSIYLVKNNLIKTSIASDVSNKAVLNAKENMKKAKLDKKISVRCGNGLEVLNEEDEVNTILISGMGTKTILEILNNKYLKNIDKLIIQSNNDHDLLREEIVKLGYIITSEDFLEDAKIHYINIVFKKGYKLYSKQELKYGPILIKNKEYLEFELAKLNKVYKLIPKTLIKYRFSLKKDINEIKKLLKKC